MATADPISKKRLSNAPRVSLAIPVYNEEAAVPELLRRRRNALNGLPGGPHEVVLVDDGSSDQTVALLEQAAQQDPRLVVVELSRNFATIQRLQPPGSRLRRRRRSNGW